MPESAFSSFKKERAFTTLARIGRIFIASVTIVCTLGCALLSKSIRKLISKKAETIRFAVAVPANQALPPIGITNHGNSCWFASAIQMLLASPYFEEIVCESLAKNGPQPVLKAILELIERQKGRDPQGISTAVRKLHEAFCHHDAHFYRPGFGSDPYEVINSIYSELKWPDRIMFSTTMEHFFRVPLQVHNPAPVIEPLGRSKMGGVIHLGPAEIPEHPFKKLVEDGKQLPDLIYIRNIDSAHPDDLAQIIHLLEFGAKYRVIAVTKSTPGHEAAYVRTHNRWYLVDDQVVTQASIQEVNRNLPGNIILERIKT